MADRVSGLPLRDRERLIEEQLLEGNVPSFLRQLSPIAVSATVNGKVRDVVYYVTPDYLAVGADHDFLRIPLSASTSQRIADRLGCMLPTRKIVNDVHRAAVLKLKPKPFSPDAHDIITVPVFQLSHRAIEEQRSGRPGLVSGIKKDLVVSALLATHPDRICIYGWHRPTGEPIQPLSKTHNDYHVDYSHGSRLVLRRALVDGQPRELPALLADPDLWPLVSDEGPVGSWRYPDRRR